MAVPGPGQTIPAHDRRALAAAWLERTAQACPGGAAEILLSQPDRFRNPAGYTLRQALPPLLDAVLGDADLEAAAPVLEQLMRLRAVQASSDAEAISFVLLLRPLLSRQAAPDPRIEQRIDRLALVASDACARCRERLLAAQANERRRRQFLPQRMSRP